MCETVYAKCKKCKKQIWKGGNVALFFRKGRYFIRRHRSSMTVRGKSGWYCNECAEELLLKNDTIINTT